MYVSVKGGEQAIDNAHRWLPETRRSDESVPELGLAQIEQQLSGSIDRVMSEGSLYDRELAALAIKQARGDLIEAVSIRKFFARTAGVATTEITEDATFIQTRHRIPELPLSEQQTLVYQVPIPEPLRWMEPSEGESRRMHALQEYGVMRVSLYEDVARHGRIAKTYDYPVLVDGRYIMSPSPIPIPKFDNPKMDGCPALQLFGAGRERRLYAVPPYTRVKSLDFEDYPFHVESWDEPCALCGARDTYLDEIITDDQGCRMLICSDTDHCSRRQAADEAPARRALS